jgi:NADH-quinone oxidoreductase subunit A
MARVYIPLLAHFIAVVAIALGMLGLSWWVGVKRPTKEKLSPYECGITPVGDARGSFSVSFYLIGMLFLLFDVEAVFLYPWAVVYKSLLAAGYKWSGFIEMTVYIAILLAGYIYIWKKGALDWTR